MRPDCGTGETRVETTVFSAGMRVEDARRALAARLSEAGIESARLDARLLVEAAVGETREHLVMAPARELSRGEADQLAQLCGRRLAHEPVSRILGERSFYGRSFEVTPETLDPRSDTETLIDVALAIAREEGWRERPCSILDVGTGTGCILLTLLAEMPVARGLGTDVSAAALAVASRNARRLGLEDRSRWQCTRGLAGIEGSFNLIVSNPPYIPSLEIGGLEPEVRMYDPLSALDGGADGLDLYREIVAASARQSPPACWYVVEVGAGQAEAVVGLVAAQLGDRANATLRVVKDLGGHSRCVAWKTLH